MTQAADGIINTADRSVRFEREYSCSKDRVWQALTDRERLSRWLGNVTGELRPGGEYRLDFGDGDVATGQIMTCEQPDRLTVTWEFPDEGTTRVDVELVDTASGTRMVFTHTGLRSSDLAQYGAGWHTFLDHLDVTLSGDNPSGWYEQYRQRFPRYRSKVSSDVWQNS